MNLARGARGGLALACLFLLCPAAAHARQSAATRPARTAAPAQPVPAGQGVAKPPARVEPVRPEDAPRTRPRPAQSPAAPAAPVAPARAVPPRRPASPVAPMPPRQLVTVVHRLSGWKLLTWLAATGPPALELDELPSLADAHTNIVAGYVHEDGRSVVARLPQAEVELDPFAAPPKALPFFAPAADASKVEPEYMLVTPEGKRVEAKFVGLDSSTGLSLLEAGERLLTGGPTGDQGDTEDPTVGQRVLFYAPTPAGGARANAAQAPEAGIIYLSINQKEGLVTRVGAAPTGRPSNFVVSASVTPAWVGAVAATEAGDVVGIVSQSRDGETQVVPMAAVRGACERVLKHRGNAPQPWLGVRGDAAAQAPLDAWVNFGWRPEAARPLIERRKGVILTSVPPGTPAAVAGLRPGDLIASVGPSDVRTLEDLSWTLREAGVGSVVDFTVWRAFEQGPRKVSVELKGAKNPAFATALAEERALRGSLLDAERDVRAMRAAQALLKTNSAPPQTQDFARLSEQLVAAEARSAVLREQLLAATEKLGTVRFYHGETPPAAPQAQAGGLLARARLKTFGLNVIGLTPKSAALLGAKGGLLVVAVRPESPAAASGLLAGDVIETLNGAAFALPETRLLPAEAEAAPLVFGLVREGRRLKVNFPPAQAPEPRR